MWFVSHPCVIRAPSQGLLSSHLPIALLLPPKGAGCPARPYLTPLSPHPLKGPRKQGEGSLRQEPVPLPFQRPGEQVWEEGAGGGSDASSTPTPQSVREPAVMGREGWRPFSCQESHQAFWGQTGDLAPMTLSSPLFLRATGSCVPARPCVSKGRKQILSPAPPSCGQCGTDLRSPGSKGQSGHRLHSAPAPLGLRGPPGVLPPKMPARGVPSGRRSLTGAVALDAPVAEIWRGRRGRGRRRGGPVRAPPPGGPQGCTAGRG